MRVCGLFLALAFAVAHSFGGPQPTLVFISGEFEYDSKRTFPEFAAGLARDYQVETLLLARPDDPKLHSIPGLEKLGGADLVVLMIRRMVLPEEQINRIKKYLESGKPLIGLRTASHAFENWKEFDARVLGGNYQNHYGNRFKTAVSLVPEAREHPILRNVTGFISDGSLYKNSPLRDGAVPLLWGTIEGERREPVAWTHQHGNARIFYTSLGHPNDFKSDSFRHLLKNGIEWALAKPLEKRSRP